MGAAVGLLIGLAVFCASGAVLFPLAFAPRGVKVFRYAEGYDRPVALDLDAIAAAAQAITPALHTEPPAPDAAAAVTPTPIPRTATILSIFKKIKSRTTPAVAATATLDARAHETIADRDDALAQKTGTDDAPAVANFFSSLIARRRTARAEATPAAPSRALALDRTTVREPGVPGATFAPAADTTHASANTMAHENTRKNTDFVSRDDAAALHAQTLAPVPPGGDVSTTTGPTTASNDARDNATEGGTAAEAIADAHAALPEANDAVPAGRNLFARFSLPTPGRARSRADVDAHPERPAPPAAAPLAPKAPTMLDKIKKFFTPNPPVHETPAAAMPEAPRLAGIDRPIGISIDLSKVTHTEMNLEPETAASTHVTDAPSPLTAPTPIPEAGTNDEVSSVSQIASYLARSRSRSSSAVEFTASRFTEEAQNAPTISYAWVNDATKSEVPLDFDAKRRRKLLRVYGTINSPSSKAMLERVIAEDPELADEARQLLQAHG